jgi:3-methyladenine DNA glycosylase AlkC
VVDKLVVVRETSLESRKSVLTELAQDRDEWVQQRVMQNLDELSELDEQSDFLRKVLLQTRRATSEHDQVRQMAVEKLIATEDRSEETQALLQDLTRDEDPQIRKLALNSLDSLFERDDLAEILVSNLRHAKEKVREDSLLHLEKIYSDNEIFEQLHQYLQTAKLDVLEWIIFKLEHYGSAEYETSYQEIRQWLKSGLSEASSPEARFQYRRALEALEEIIDRIGPV